MRRRAPAGPSLFDDEPEVPQVPAPAPVPVQGTPDGVTPVQGAVPDAEVERVAALYGMSPAERAASQVPVPDRSRWTWPGKGTVEVRGTSPLMVWFALPDAPALAQQTVYRHEFLKRAVRQ